MADLSQLLEGLDKDEAGQFMYQIIKELYPLCRSITGDGVRRTLEILGSHVDLQRSEIPTGTRVFDWEVPPEWNIRGAWVRDPSGQTIIDFNAHNLHVMSYSEPVHTRCSLAELKAHLYSDPENPDWIPYRTSYYHRTWGFCVPHRMLSTLPEGEYEVFIDSTLAPGALTLGECTIPGESSDEVLLFAHCCHPSLCNDNLSGLAVLTCLATMLRRCRLRHTYRIVFAPATIGSITWLSRNEHRLPDIVAGLVVSLVGDGAAPTYKRSRRGDAWVDRAATCVLAAPGRATKILEFEPWGYDERQFCSPGIDLPMGRLTRSVNGEFPEYHTSADNLDFVAAEHLADSLGVILKIIEILEYDRRLVNLCPKGEPQLGRRGLYESLGGTTRLPELRSALLWVLNFSDGNQSLLDIALRSGLPFRAIRVAAETAESHGLLAQA